MKKIKSLINPTIFSNKFKIIALFTLIILFTFSYKVYVWINTQSTDNAYIKSDITAVSPEVSGVIRELYFIENQKVNKDDLLLKIDTRMQKAMYEQAKAKVDVLLSKIKLGHIEFARYRAKEKLAEHSLEVANKEYRRVQSLGNEKFSSKKQLENTYLRVKKTKTELEEASLSVKSAEQNIETLEAELKAAQIEASGVNDSEGIAKINYNNTELKSPISGYITNNGAKIGGFARQGFPLFYIVPKDKIYVKANFKETQISKFRQNMEAVVQFDALNKVKFNGKIRNIFPATGSQFSLIPTDNATGNFTKIVQRVPVIIDVEIPEEYIDKIAVGYSAYVSIRTDQ